MWILTPTALPLCLPHIPLRELTMVHCLHEHTPCFIMQHINRLCASFAPFILSVYNAVVQNEDQWVEKGTCSVRVEGLITHTELHGIVDYKLAHALLFFTSLVKSYIYLGYVSNKVWIPKDLQHIILNDHVIHGLEFDLLCSSCCVNIVTVTSSA